MKINPKAIIRSITEGTVFFIDNFERLAIVIVSRIAPWAAPLAPAYLVATTVQKHFETPDVIGIAVGVTLEAVGIATTHITLEMYQYNQTKLKNQPEAPFIIGLLVTFAYFLIGLSLTVVLELVPNLVIIAPAAFFLLAIVAYVALALMSGHSRRVQGIQLEKEDKAEAKRNRGGTKPELGTGINPATGGETMERARRILAECPDITGSELGRQLGKSTGLGRKLKRELVLKLSSNGKEPLIKEEELT